jgi:hypothetical protein
MILGGYYVVLDGLVFITDNDNDNDNLNHERNTIITLDGIIALAENDSVFLKVSHDTFKDKSKPDVLAKG